ncbi:MAG: AmmeMemoRadiSam system protein A [Chloroflexota bacterium]
MTTPTAGPAPVEVSEPDRARLLELARAAVGVAAGARQQGDLDDAIDAGPVPAFPAAVFVTLLVRDELRGCMGTLDPDGAVWAAVVETAGWAARRDPRFEPVRARELASIKIDVSILGPMEPLADPATFRPGTDGIVIMRAGHRGLLLPEVADDVGHGPTDMLEAVCRKAGLRSGAWREEGTSLSVFRTLRFGGPALVAQAAPGA